MRPASGGSLRGKMKTRVGLHRETRVGLHRETRVGLHRETRVGLHRERCAATASACGVGVFDDEPCADEFFGEVDCRIGQKR